MKKILLFCLKNRISVFIVSWIFYWHWHLAAKKKKTPSDIKNLRLMFGHDPLISNKYWNNALRRVGIKSDTLMKEYFASINAATDYNFYFKDIIENNYQNIPGIIKWAYFNYFISDYILKNYDVVHLCVNGSVIGKTKWANRQAELFKKFKVTTVIVPYGGDYQIYSQMLNPSMRQALLISYPDSARREIEIKKRLDYWIEKADVFFSGFQIDGIGRWDILPFNMVTINEEEWTKSSKINSGDGVNGDPIVIVHTPNHRGVKGTEFFLAAIDVLKREGLKIELILLEGVQNSEVRKILSEKADILVEQLMGGAYALSAIEGMASGITVVTNLQEEIYSRLFRRFSYLNECPILSGSPENIESILRLLIKNPSLRKDLGDAGRSYVEKYHSNKTAQYMFCNVYDDVIFKNKKDLINMFHPLNPGSYNNQSPLIKHPLFENRIPDELMSKLNK